MTATAPPTIELELRPAEYVPEFLRDGWVSRAWLKFYPGDWFGDDQLAGLPLDARGLYLEAIFRDAQAGFLMSVELEFDLNSTSIELQLSPNSTSIGGQLEANSAAIAAEFAAKMQTNPRTARRLMPKILDHFFVTSAGYVINKRQERERCNAREEREKKRGQRANVPGLSPPMSPDTRARLPETRNQNPPNPPGGTGGGFDREWTHLRALAADRDDVRDPGAFVAALRRKHQHPRDAELPWWEGPGAAEARDRQLDDESRERHRIEAADRATAASDDERLDVIERSPFARAARERRAKAKQAEGLESSVSDPDDDMTQASEAHHIVKESNQEEL